MLKTWIFFFLFISACLAIPAGAKRLTHGFKIAKMWLEFPIHPSWNVSSAIEDEEAKVILAQPFHYLNKGAQSYAFLSQDGRYVLKIFRFDQRHLFRKKNKRPLEQKVNKFFQGCVLASTKASEETGILYLHLNPQSGRLPILKAKGPLGQPFSLELDQYRFVLQKKAIPLDVGLLAAKKEGNLPARIEEIVSLLESRIKKGIGNADPSLWRNFGFLEDRAIEFDFGNYLARPDLSLPKNARAEMERYTRHLRTWLERNAPDLVANFNERVERSLTGLP